MKHLGDRKQLRTHLYVKLYVVDILYRRPYVQLLQSHVAQVVTTRCSQVNTITRLRERRSFSSSRGIFIVIAGRSGNEAVLYGKK